MWEIGQICAAFSLNISIASFTSSSSSKHRATIPRAWSTPTTAAKPIASVTTTTTPVTTTVTSAAVGRTEEVRAEEVNVNNSNEYLFVCFWLVEVVVVSW